MQRALRVVGNLNMEINVPPVILGEHKPAVEVGLAIRCHDEIGLAVLVHDAAGEGEVFPGDRVGLADFTKVIQHMISPASPG